MMPLPMEIGEEWFRGGVEFDESLVDNSNNLLVD
jgi:hypothetical protein